ncbi:MAG: hypothetical protein R3323_09575 [Wenzhouxiangellaceae bacterium]|nr:hypothetical protein [Wenzhouxiangellaceae bacterium]
MSQRWTQTVAAAVVALAAASTGTAEEEAGKAHVSGGPGYPANDLFAVEFAEIDGRNIPDREDLWLEPGTYRLTVIVPERFTESKINQSQRFDTTDYVDFDLTVEAGKRYEIRGRWNRLDRDDPYDIVIHDVVSD